MTALVFVDSNVILYSLDLRDPTKQTRAQDWLNSCWHRNNGRISTQVINEFYHNATTKFSRFTTKDIARETVRDLRLWQPPHLDTYTVDGAWSLQDRYHLSYWDALIVSSAQQQGCKYLLSEDLQDGQQFGNVTKINPFLHTPEEVLGAA